MIKSSAQMKTMHLIIGIIVAVVLANLPGPGSITQHGMALIGTFIVANYWFIAIDMITGSLASLVMFVLLSGTPAATAIASVFGNTTIWQMLVVLPLIYGLRVTGVDDALTGWMVSRKALRSRPTMFVVFFLLTCSLLCALKVHPLVMLALAESVMSIGGYMERTKEHDAFLVSTFFASALASNIIPYGSWVAGFVASFEAISGVPLDQATYMLFGIALNIVLDILYVVVMSLFLKCDFSRLEKIDLNALQVTQTQFTKRGRFMLLLFLVMIREYLSRIKTTAKSVALEKRYENEIAEMKAHKREAEQENKRCKERLAQLSSEIAKSLTDESAFAPDVLAMAIDNTQAELRNSDERLVQLNYGLNNSQGAMKKLDFYYDQFRGWAEVFEDASMEQRKMIICQLVKEINVSRGYGMDIVLDMNYEQFLSA